MKSSTSEFLTIRGLKCHVRLWGPADAPKLFLLHGWMDCSASFQFLVDAFARDWRVIAPDWRGFGQSEWLNASYWFPDYLADLECLLEYYAPDEPVRLVGHSMGGNVVGLYAGVRPARVAKLAILEGFGLHPTEPAQAPGRYAKWLDQDKAGATLRDYAGLGEFAARLMRDNPRLTQAQADFLAANFSQRRTDGRIGYAADPWHRVVSPLLYRFEEAVDYPVTRVERSWAGLRSFAPDRTPVAGFDPTAEGFFWLAGQGGYGIQTAPALSMLAGRLIRRATPPAGLEALVAPLSPARFRRAA